MKTGGAVEINGTGIPYFRIYAPSATSVKINGQSTPFVQVGDHVEPVNVTVDRTWSGDIFAATTVKVAPAVSLTITAGSNLTFANDAQLIVKGALSATGDAEHRVTFSSVSPMEQWWLGINATDTEIAPSISLEYVDISYCTNAMSIHTGGTLSMSNCTVGNVFTGVSIIPSGSSSGDQPSWSFSIGGCTFTDIGGIGILVNSTSSLIATDNTLSGGEGETVGILCDASSPRFLRNRLENFSVGLWCVNESSPELQDDIAGGNNVIRDNLWGVQCEDQSNAVLGFLSPMGNEGGQNSIYGNMQYDVTLLGKSIVSAENNWWGTPEVTGDQFSIEDGSELDYDPWLFEDPNQMRPVGVVGNEDGNSLDEPPPRLTPISDVMRRVLGERGRRNYRQAIGLLKTLMTNSTVSLDAKRWALTSSPRCFSLSI
jgi:hypothetical protein